MSQTNHIGANGPGSSGRVEPSAQGPDWTDQVTGLIVDSVDKVRDKTTGPILEYSRISVHLVVAVILMVPVSVLAMIGVIRLLTWAVGQAWISYTIIGAVMVIVGTVLWSLRSKLPV